MGDLSGQVIKGYTFRECVGSGGFGAVYRAYQAMVDREVAIKVILPEYTRNPEFERRFESEARLIARLEHPHIVPLYDYWCELEGTCLVMRWLPYTLRGALAEGPLPVEGVARLLDQSAAALSVAHRHQVIHRDLKPENLLLDEDNNVYLADFGIAKDLNRPGITKENAVAGTLAYVTPEQLSGQPVTPQTDQYSLGLVLYEALTGEAPFGQVSASCLIHKQLHEPLPRLHERRPDLPAALDAVLQQATAKDPAGRYPDVLRLAAAFRAVIAEPPSKPYQPLADPLTERELEILRLIAADCSNGEIAQQLVLAAGTVKWYVKQIYSKLAVHSREAALARAQELQLIAVERPAEPLAAVGDEPVIVRTAISAVRTVFSLPAQALPFVGRETELAALAALFADPAVRLVTILAPGGMGKTRLAIEAAERQKVGFANGACFVPLAPLSAAEHLPAAIASALQLTAYGGSDPWQQVFDYLRQKHLLLVLDNFEHLLEGAPLLGDLLAASPGLKLLVTSREQLDLSMETVFYLGGLTLPEANRPDEALRASAACLFVDSARRARPDFKLAAGGLPEVIRICHLVQGMPLGLLLAATWVELLPLREIADEISRSLDFLETDWRDLPERQRSLRAVFNSTWDRLSQTEREVFMKLSVFRGGFTRRAAQSIAGATLRVLAALVGKALLTRDEEGRCTVHELLRQFAAEQLETSEQADALRDAHSAYYLEALRQAKSDLEGHNQLVTYKNIAADLENVRAAWAWGIERRQYEALAGTTQVLWLFHYIQGRYADSERFFGEAAASLRQAPADPARDDLLADILTRQAQFAWGLAKTAERDQLLAESQALSDLSGAPAARAFRLLSAAWKWVWEYRATMAALEPVFEEALTIYGQLGCRWETAHTLQWRGMFLFFLEDRQMFDPARKLTYLQEAGAIYADLGDTFGLSFALNGLGVVTGTYLGKLEEGMQFYRESLALRRQIGHQPGIAGSLNNLAIDLAALGDLEQAEARFQEATAILHELGDCHAFDCLIAVGETLVYEGRFTEARRRFEEVVASNPAQFVWVGLYWLARLDWIQGDYDHAARGLADCLARRAVADKSEELPGLMGALLLGSDIALVKGDLAEARGYADRAVQLARTRRPQWTMACQIMLGQLAYLEGNYQEAKRVLTESWGYFQREYPLGCDIWMTVRALRILSEMASAEGEFEAARGYLWEALRLGQRLSITSFVLAALVALAELLARQGQSERAAELAALVQTHPHTYAIDRDAATSLLNTLAVDQAVYQRGTALDLQAVVSALVEELEQSGKS